MRRARRSFGRLSLGVLLLAPSPAAEPAACLPVRGERILAADLAAAVEAFSGVPPETVISFSPAPGARRLFGEAEIRRLALRHGVDPGPARPVCIVRRMEVLGRERVREALEKALEGVPAKLELIDYLRAPAPEGPLEFPRAGLGRPAPGGAALWRGAIRYGEGRTFPFWARVRVRVEAPRVVALRDLAAGRPVEPGEVEVRPVEVGLFRAPEPASVEEVAGRIPRRLIRAGDCIERRWLEAPREVSAGETVAAEIQNGAARVAFEAKAETSGRAGDSILVRNPQTGRRLRAVVVGKGKVSVDEGPGSGGLRAGGGRLGGEEGR